MATNTFGSRACLRVGERSYDIHRLDALEKGALPLGHLPYSLRILLENLLRSEDGVEVTAADIEALCRWEPGAAPSRDIAFSPGRVLLQDFTGVPAVVDLAAMRAAVGRLGGDPTAVDPLLPAELVIDHSVQVDHFAVADALARNTAIEVARNRERYMFLRWGQRAFRNLQVVPPGTGICHQVNLEHLARVVMTTDGARPQAFPDTLVGTDSHTVMINGLGVLGWGVGGIEAEAVMLGQPLSMLIPQVVGFRLTGALPEGTTATDLVLTVTQMVRKRGVVGKLVEFFGPGLHTLPLADRATIANMAPEYGATCGYFPVDAETLRYLRLTGRPEERVQLVEAYFKEQGLFHEPGAAEPRYSDTLELDLATVQPSVAGPRRPQDRVPLGRVAAGFHEALPGLLKAGAAPDAKVEIQLDGERATLTHGSVAIAAITSCTNTSNPSVMVAAGLLARRAVERGLHVPPWVKTSLAPGSKVVTDYLARAGLTPYLDRLGFQLVGYGCTTCIGNSGPLPEPVSAAIRKGALVVVSVLSGNRNFEGRINPEVRANYLMSPPLVVAYALAGRIDVDWDREPVGLGGDGKPVFLRDLWPSAAEVAAAAGEHVRPEMFAARYADVFSGDAAWQALPVPAGALYAWADESTYVRLPPYFDDLPPEPPALGALPDIRGARALAVLGDSVTTDHISPAGSIKPDGPAGRYLVEHGVPVEEFNSYGARRGNHEVMMRGTFANVRLRNLLVPGVEGGVTRHLPSGAQLSIYDAAMRYRDEGTPLVVLAGKEYGSGSSRDWAAKGPRLLGVKAVLAESFERIHRSNLVGMGLLPLQYRPGENAAALGLTGDETFAIAGVAAALAGPAPREVTVRAARPDGSGVEFRATVRVDTAREVDYYRHGGILEYVLRALASRRPARVAASPVEAG
jgi:aconitate hydratase